MVRWGVVVRPTSIGIVAALAVLAACGGDQAPFAGVLSEEPAWTGGQGWTVEMESMLILGRSEGEAPYLFHRIVGVRRTNAGMVAVSDAGSGQLRFFDETGAFVKAVGRHGQGPGEFGFSLNNCSYTSLTSGSEMLEQHR